VTVATLIAASRAQGKQLKDQTVTFVGAGSAGCGPGESQGQGSLVGCHLWGHTVRHD